MRNSISCTLLAAVILFTAGCATTTVHSVRNPELSHLAFKKVLVVAPFRDIGRRRQTEDAFVTRLSRSKIDALASIELIPPVRQYEEDELMGILKESGFDGILVAALEAYWTEDSYVPRSETTRSRTTLLGRTLHHESYTHEYGGYSISEPRMRFEIRLFDPESEKVVWMSTSLTRGEASTGFSRMAASLARGVVTQLARDGVIGK